MTLPDPPKKAQDRHYGMLTARWEGLAERGNLVKLYTAGGHCLVGYLMQDKKGYVLRNKHYRDSVIYFELGDVVAVDEQLIPKGGQEDKKV